ncbi:hypothetical protein GCM10009117_07370 [Gangjinia marincola]|uniref:DUF3078 domain-containing protein n=2 Tax=Gangjinia marincola TaxID=578463 RepID=A0ABN1MFN5_9FLAO
MTIVCLLTMVGISSAQTAEELRAQMKPKKDSISELQNEVDALQAQIDNLPGWRIGAFGVIGGNISQFNNWYSQGTPNVSSGNIAITLNAFANLKQEKFFWNNTANTNLQWLKFDDEDDDTDDDSYREATDVFNISTLYGRTITKKLFASALAEYRTTLLDNTNNPGYLDVGIGATWKPITNLIIVAHPLNYNFVFADNDEIFQSSLGAKIVADYTRKIGKLNLKSNFSTFQSYEDSDLSNWTWINTLNYTFWKGIGLGFELGLRDNSQETLAFERAQALAAVSDPPPADFEQPTFDSIDNEIQSYWLIGLSYSF